MPRAVLLCARCLAPALWLEDADGRCPGPRCEAHPGQTTWIGTTEDEATQEPAEPAESRSGPRPQDEPRQMGLWEDAR